MMRLVSPKDFVFIERYGPDYKSEGYYKFTVTNHDGKSTYLEWGTSNTPFMFANENTERAQEVWQRCLQNRRSNYRWRNVEINDEFVIKCSKERFETFWKDYHEYYGGKYLMILKEDENEVHYVVIGNRMHDDLPE